MFKNLKPLGDRVLVERAEKEEKTAGGIFIPTDNQEKGQTGTVLNVGPGKDKSPTVKVGDTVYFGKFSGTELDETLLILREDEIIGILS